MEENKTRTEGPTISTSAEIESQLSRSRALATLFKVLTYGCGAGMILAFFFLQQIAAGIVLLLAALVSAVLMGKYQNAVKRLLTNNVTTAVLKETFGENFEYNPRGRVHPGSMVFPFSYNKTDGSDYIRTVYKGLNIELSDIELIQEDETIDADGNTSQSSDTVFKGQWLICDFGKELAGEVYVSERTKKDPGKMKSTVAMESEAFNDRFCVRAENPQEAYYILTPHMMEYITAMSDKSGGSVYLSFLRGGKLHVAVRTGRDFFELGSSSADINALRQKFLDELHWFTDIIDTLRVEDTIYKKS